MKITFATTWDSECGVAAYSRSLVAELEDHTVIEVVSLDPGADVSPAWVAARLNSGEVAHIQHQYPFFGGMAFHRNWFRRLLMRMDVPLVVTVHELDLGEADSRPVRGYKRWFNRRLFGAAEIDRIIVHTAEYRDKLAGLGVEPADIRVIPEGVPAVSAPPISAEDAKSELGLAGKKVVTIFGFVVRRKGYGVALEALRHWPADVVLLIAGGPHPSDRTGFFDELKSRIASENLSERVTITGYLPDDKVPVAMAATDVMAGPFTAMSNSGSIVRAIAYGRPIVASDLPAARDINERLPCLLLFNVGDPLDLAAKVEELLEDERKREEAIAGVRAYAEDWPVARAAADTLVVYQDLHQASRTERL